MIPFGHGTPWIRYDEAMEFIKGCTDLGRKQFLMLALTQLLTRLSQREQPAAPFDLLFFAKAVDQMFERRDALTRILAGEDLRWWSDE